MYVIFLLGDSEAFTDEIIRFSKSKLDRKIVKIEKYKKFIQFFNIILTIIASIVSLLSSITLKYKIAEDLKNKKETLSEKEIYLLQKLAGVKTPKK